MLAENRNASVAMGTLDQQLEDLDSSPCFTASWLGTLIHINGLMDYKWPPLLGSIISTSS